jgi:soluble epoxide hydrolase/lipid-phosphate phosphatase
VTAYLESGPDEGDVIVLVHGWPEASWAWRHHLEVLGARGHRVIAPDLRGCGGSTVYKRHGDYALRHLVADSVGLLDALDIEHATWVGHDWGAPVVWTTARHHPDRVVAAGSLSTPYDTLEYGLERMVSFVRRDVYPEAEYPVGQLDYIAFYQENFAAAQEQFEDDVPAFFTTVMRAGEPGKQGEPYSSATVRRRGGWFDGGPAPRLPLDETVIDGGLL